MASLALRRSYTPTSDYNTFYGGYDLPYINDGNTAVCPNRNLRAARLTPWRSGVAGELARRGEPQQRRAKLAGYTERRGALAAVYDVLISKRVYKDAFSHDVAMGIITNEAGTQFDPAIVEAFKGSEEAFLAIRGVYLESRTAA